MLGIEIELHVALGTHLLGDANGRSKLAIGVAKPVVALQLIGGHDLHALLGLGVVNEERAVHVLQQLDARIGLRVHEVGAGLRRVLRGVVVSVGRTAKVGHGLLQLAKAGVLLLIGLLQGCELLHRSGLISQRKRLLRAGSVSHLQHVLGGDGGVHPLGSRCRVVGLLRCRIGVRGGRGGSTCRIGSLLRGCIGVGLCGGGGGGSVIGALGSRIGRCGGLLRCGLELRHVDKLIPVVRIGQRVSNASHGGLVNLFANIDRYIVQYDVVEQTVGLCCIVGRSNLCEDNLHPCLCLCHILYVLIVFFT